VCSSDLSLRVVREMRARRVAGYLECFTTLPVPKCVSP
jgi:hypothetical protein